MSTTYATIGVSSGGVGVSTIILKALATLTGSNGGTLADFELSNVQSPAVVQALSLANGANTINTTTCPALATAGAVILRPPTSNTNALTLKGVSGDTGISLNPAAPHLLTFASTPPTSFVITTTGGITGFELIWL